MSQEARVRIESHRLLRKDEVPLHEEKVVHIHSTVRERMREEKSKWKGRLFVHLIVFVLSFVFTSGVALLAIVTFVDRESLLSIVVTGVLSGFVFVLSFASLRYLTLHKLLDEKEYIDEDPGIMHHASKSVAYGLVALVIAVIVTGFFVKLASAIVV